MENLLLKDDRVPELLVREQVKRISLSEPFARSNRLNRFIQFTVEALLAHKEDALKEYTIGTQVYDRKASYLTSRDSIVRTEASRLRNKLDQYYAMAGKFDPVIISYRPGSYAPVIQLRSNARRMAELPTRRVDNLFTGTGITVTVLTFQDLSQTSSSSLWCRSIEDELLYQLMRTQGFRVTGSCTASRFSAFNSARASAFPETSVQICFEGSVREEGNRLRVTCRALDSDGFQIWSERFDCDSNRGSRLTQTETLASAIVRRFNPHQGDNCHPHCLQACKDTQEISWQPQ